MKSNFTYIFDGKEYNVFVSRKLIRNIYFRFKDNAFYISSPYFVSDKEIEERLNKHSKRLIEKNKKRIYLNNNSKIYYLGKEVKIIDDKFAYFSDGSILTFTSKDSLINELIKSYKILMIERTRYYENIMGIKTPYKIRFRKMKTRYGSNSSKTHSICYESNLYVYSLDILDSLIVHELSHYFYRDHSKKFYQIVTKYCPNYIKYNKKLKNGDFE